MKFVFYLFFLILSFLPTNLFAENNVITENTPHIPLTETASEPQPQGWMEKLEFLKQLNSKKIEIAKNQTPADISLIDKPENMNLYTLFFLGTKDAGILTGEKGLGKKHTFDFGSAGLVSCMGNLNNQNTLITALYVQLNSGWHLKKPNIPHQVSTGEQQETVLYPLRLNRKHSQTYESSVLFPIIYQLTNPLKPFHIEKEIALTACKQNNCITQTQLYQLTVDNGKGYQTDICPAILSEINKSTTPLPQNVEVFAHGINNQLQIIVTYPHNIKDFELKIDNEFSFQIQKKVIHKNKVITLIQSDTNIEFTQPLMLKLLTPDNWYETTILPDKKPFETIPPTFSWVDAVFSGFMLLFFSVFYLLFWSIRPQNHQELKQIIRIVKQLSVSVALIFGILLYANVPLGNIMLHPILLIIQVGILLYLLWRPFVQIKKAFVFLFLMPYPYLYEYFLTFPIHSIMAFVLSAWWGFCCILPFLLFQKCPQFFQALEQAQKPLNKLIRLPLIMLLGWMSLLLYLTLFPPQNNFSESALKAALQDNKSVFVSVQKNPCITCTANQLSAKYFYPTESFVQNKNLLLMTVYQTKSTGKKLSQHYNVTNGISFNVLYSPTHPNGIYIPNTYLETADWAEYLVQIGLLK